VADAGMNADDSATAEIASDRTTANDRMAAPSFYPTRPAVGMTPALSGNTVLASTLSSTLR
jgi:hypothetical protein